LSLVKAIRNIKRGDARSERGQTLVEYVLILGVFSVALIAGLTWLYSGGVNPLYQRIITAVEALV